MTLVIFCEENLTEDSWKKERKEESFCFTKSLSVQISLVIGFIWRKLLPLSKPFYICTPFGENENVDRYTKYNNVPEENEKRIINVLVFDLGTFKNGRACFIATGYNPASKMNSKLNCDLTKLKKIEDVMFFGAESSVSNVLNFSRVLWNGKCKKLVLNEQENDLVL